MTMFDFNSAVEKYRELILAAERYIWQNPETGYKEYKTDAYMKKIFTDLSVGTRVRLCTEQGEFFAIGEVREYENGSAIKSIKMFDV